MISLFNRARDKYQLRLVTDSVGLPGIAFVARMTGSGDLDGLVVGFSSFSLDAGQMSVDYSIISIPPALAKHKDQFFARKGSHYKRARKELDKLVTVFISLALQEIIQENTDAAARDV